MSSEQNGSNMNGPKSNKKTIVVVAVAFTLVGLLIAFITTVAVKETSAVNFCSSCHSMQPMADSYLKSVHGGYGKTGFVAQCVDCHLPHESTLGYLVQKVRTGIHDVVAEITLDTYRVDWEEKREERREFLYDSSCLHCHENLLNATKPNKKAYVAHKAYFSGKLKVEVEHKKESAMCVDCHKYVGHYKLGEHLKKIGTVYDEDFYNYKRSKPNYAAAEVEPETEHAETDSEEAETEVSTEHHE